MRLNNKKPKLRILPVKHGDNWIFDGIDNEISVSFKDSQDQDIELFFKKFNGLNSLDDISKYASLNKIICDIEQLFLILEKNFVFEPQNFLDYYSGIEAILDIEDSIYESLYKGIYKNKFWEACRNSKEPVKDTILYGMAIENWHFLHNESFFDTPILAINTPPRVRTLLLDFFNEEHRHDDYVLDALKSTGLSKTDLVNSVPLPQTVALISALTYWSRTDPLFFMATLGVLEGVDVEIDSYVSKLLISNLPKEFISSMKAHSDINIKHGHGNLTRTIFNEYQCIQKSDIVRIKAQMPLFLELYDAFFSGIWDYYSQFEDIQLSLHDRIIR